MKRLYLVEKDVQRFIQRLKEEEKSPSTIDKYARDVRKFIKFMAGRRLSKKLMLEYKSLLIKSHKPAGVNSILAGIKTFLRYNELERFAVKRLKCQRTIFCPKEKELSKWEYSHLVKTAQVNGQERLFVIMQVICSTGIRVGELKFFTAEALRNGRIEVTNKGKTRVIFITTDLRKVLNWYCKKNCIFRGPIFISRRGNCIDRKTVWADMKKLCKNAGVSEEKVYPHNLRHLFARSYYDIRKDITRLADILGHSNIDTTRHYLVSTGMEHESDLNKMDLVLGCEV